MAIEYTHEPRTVEGVLRHLLQSGCDIDLEAAGEEVVVVNPEALNLPCYIRAPGLVTAYDRAKGAGWLNYPNEGLDK